MTNAGVPRTLRFGILCDEIDLAAWHIKCLEALIRVPGCIHVVGIERDTGVPRNALPPPGGFDQKRIFRLVCLRSTCCLKADAGDSQNVSCRLDS